MQFIETGFKDLWLIEPDIFQDQRGYFFEAFNAKEFKKSTGIDTVFVQQNQSKSTNNVLRGMHLQIGEAAQAKLVHILKGKVLDVVVDLRRGEPTFGNYYSVELSGENQRQLYVPRGMAHGFLVLEEDTLFTYSCDNYYNPQAELTLRYDDSDIQIEWPKLEGLKLSPKDQAGLDLKKVLEKMYG
ncbi:dTDP-4-dehydrorhamnose 3,5-epimerase [Leeuwenhoekiella nanhaiensis]|uniref:dTDP-4-dehydrorhamnose 3,5-epimerase n=1 Tax=Leeuwenhoekiella nanhaiensis TaxID=1655491 RepID=A0A2G1VVC9_9FLAO|nr:dTDP-4-dehydrorhamnose 3,5-epimerase [Leeuwenhoekiella nanhaiensis]PHQ30580.1 dTDP-4-dehydrorhamnose 3,5-epimerase [Leeuwenhoekiella nanhaiensis]